MPRPEPEWLQDIQKLTSGQSAIIEAACTWHAIRKLLRAREIAEEYEIKTLESGARYEVRKK